MLVANLTYRQKTISQRFNSVVIGLIVGLIVGLLPICRKTTFKAENT
jgi:F0F1-type ATP synthase assembly protein I